MTTAATHHRPVRLLAVASGGFILIVALAAAASPSSARGAAAGTPAAAGARAAAPGGTWGTAQQVPGIAALNKGGLAKVTSVSCAKPGDCSAGGLYEDASSKFQAFVAGEVNGVWGKAQQVPGTAALNKGGLADIPAVSCARAGACSAGGSYLDAASKFQAFVAGEVHGARAKAQQVPGTAALNTGGSARILSVSCARAGGCSAGGFYEDASGHRQAFVAGEVKGVWGTAQQVPGAAGLDKGGVGPVHSGSRGKGGDRNGVRGHRCRYVPAP